MNRIVAKRSQLAFLLLCVTTAIVSRAQTFTTLASFNFADGGYPASSLVEGLDGNFYGVTPDGGSLDCYPLGCGALFRMSPQGAITLLNNFPCSLACLNGAKPIGSLVLASDGNFYGTTTAGGNYNNCSIFQGCGTIFELSADGRFRTVHAFVGKTEGGLSSAALIQATDGNLYGTARVGGVADAGTVFQVTLQGKVTTLHSFRKTDGSDPIGALVQGSNGNFYGTTSSGGAHDAGTVFEVTPQGDLSTLHDFCSDANCADGSSPVAGLVLTTNGNFYGTTRGGVGKAAGTIFEITPTGTLTTLYTFCAQARCADGNHPKASLIQASDGNLYGTTFSGGVQRQGTIFEITPTGTLTTLHRFQYANGANPYGGLMQASSGNFYGLATYGGTGTFGIAFSLSTGLSSFVGTRLVATPGQR